MTTKKAAHSWSAAKAKLAAFYRAGLMGLEAVRDRCKPILGDGVGDDMDDLLADLGDELGGRSAPGPARGLRSDPHRGG